MHYQVVFIIHGVGDQNTGYSQAMQQKLDVLLDSYSNHRSQVTTIYKEIDWSDITQDVQDELFIRSKRGTHLGQLGLRSIMINLIGDAVAYQDSDRGRIIYQALHATIAQAFQDVQQQIGNDPVEYSFVAHSLGSVIASDYCYDQRATLQLCNFFTMGSPIALWSMRSGHPDNADEPVRVDPINGTWINIFDDDDVIGWPLKTINQYYNDAVDFDYNTQIGGPISRELPLSHRGYWTDGNACKPIAKKIALDQERLINNTPLDKPAYIAFIQSLWNI